MNLVLIKVMIALAVLAALAFGVNRYNAYQQQQGYDKRVGEDNIALIAAQDRARLQEQVWRDKKTEVENDGLARERLAATRLNTVVTERNRLRDDITYYRNGLPGATDAAARETADTGLRLLGECSEAYLGMASAATGHLNDVKTLSEAWPK